MSHYLLKLNSGVCFLRYFEAHQKKKPRQMAGLLTSKIVMCSYQFYKSKYSSSFSRRTVRDFSVIGYLLPLYQNANFGV